MGILMTANIVYANQVVNIDMNLHTACEPGGVYERVGIVQRRSYEMNIGGSLSILDADERVFPYPKGLLSARFAVLILLAMAISQISFSEKRSGYRRYGRRIWTRRTVYWRQQSISRATYVRLARETRVRRSTETEVYSTIQVVEEDGYNVVAALPKADIITSPSLQKPKRITIQNSVVNRELRDRNFTEKPLPFIFNRKRTKRRIRFVRKCGNSSMTSPVKRRKPQNDISKRRKKRIHGVGHQILKRELLQESHKIPIYPKYHIAISRY